MLVILENFADRRSVQAELSALGLWTECYSRSDSNAGGILRVLSSSASVTADRLQRLPGVSQIFQSSSPHPRVDAQRGQDVTVAGVTFGASSPPILIAGPCAAESEEQVAAAAKMAQRAGARFLRGGAYKPRTSPYSFSGHGKCALTWLRDACDRTGLSLVTEVLSESDVGPVSEIAEIVQIGSRNMQNFALLRALGQQKTTVLLKRGRSATLQEWLLSAEWLLDAGALGVIFCERGVQSFDTTTRNLLDLGTVANLRHILGLVVVVDPSHAAGRRDLVLALGRAALGAGANGLMVECHPDPKEAQSDGPQALGHRELEELGRCLHS